MLPCADPRPCRTRVCARRAGAVPWPPGQQPGTPRPACGAALRGLSGARACCRARHGRRGRCYPMAAWRAPHHGLPAGMARLTSAPRLTPIRLRLHGRLQRACLRCTACFRTRLVLGRCGAPGCGMRTFLRTAADPRPALVPRHCSVCERLCMRRSARRPLCHIAAALVEPGSRVGRKACRGWPGGRLTPGPGRQFRGAPRVGQRTAARQRV
jgi:hypothetical protein